MRTKVLCAMGMIMLVCLMVLGMFAFPVGLPLCGLVGLIYGIMYRDRRLAGWSLAVLLVGVAAALYTWLLILRM